MSLGLKLLEGEFAIIAKGTKNGYAIKQVDVYAYAGRVWIKEGSWFIALMKDGHTSFSNLSWRSITLDEPTYDRQGRMQHPMEAQNEQD